MKELDKETVRLKVTTKKVGRTVGFKSKGRRRSAGERRRMKGDANAESTVTWE